jgi:hypothetical protein
MRGKNETVEAGYELEVDDKTFITTRDITIYSEMDRYHLAEHPHIFRSAEGPYHALLFLMQFLFYAANKPEECEEFPTEFVEGLFQLKSMGNKKLEQEFLDTFLLIPTKEQVTQSQMNAMMELAKVFSNFPAEQAEVTLSLFKDIVGHPDKVVKVMSGIGIDQTNMNMVKGMVELLESLRAEEQKRAN